MNNNEAPAETVAETLARWAALDAAYVEVAEEFRPEFLPHRRSSGSWAIDRLPKKLGELDLVVDTAFYARLDAKLSA